MRKIILAGVAALALCVHADAANWPSTSGSTVPGSVIEDGAGQKIFGKATYRYAQSTITFAATFTDVWVIGGSASKTVRINSIILCGTATAATNLDIALVRRSTADTGGTSGAFTAIPSDVNNPGVTATVLNYTANPTLGTAFGNASVRKLNVGVAGSAGCQTWTFGSPTSGQPLTLRGTAQQIAVNFGGVAVPAGLSLTFDMETTEE